MPKVQARFVGHKSFVGSTEGKDAGNVDSYGHGTHEAWLLHTVAPNADIYVARVTKDPVYPVDFGKGVAAVRYLAHHLQPQNLCLTFLLGNRTRH
jgi:hypothetical protein